MGHGIGTKGASMLLCGCKEIEGIEDSHSVLNIFYLRPKGK